MISASHLASCQHTIIPHHWLGHSVAHHAPSHEHAEQLGAEEVGGVGALGADKGESLDLRHWHLRTTGETHEITASPHVMTERKDTVAQWHLLGEQSCHFIHAGKHCLRGHVFQMPPLPSELRGVAMKAKLSAKKEAVSIIVFA